MSIGHFAAIAQINRVNEKQTSNIYMAGGQDPGLNLNGRGAGPRAK